MIRFLASICLHFIANAAGLIFAALLLPGFDIDPLSFISVVVVFTVIGVVTGPLVEKTAATSAPALSGGVALVTAFAGLALTDYFSDGLTITGLNTWLLAPLIVWLCTLLAAVILPLFLFRKILRNRKDARDERGE